MSWQHASERRLVSRAVSAADAGAREKTKDGRMASKMDLYNHDFYTWTQQQAALLRESKVHDLDCTK